MGKKKKKYVKIELELEDYVLQYIDDLVTQGILGKNRSEVVNHILKDYLSRHEGAIYD